MENNGPVLEYQEGELFRSQPNFIVMLVMMFMIFHLVVSIVMLLVLMALRFIWGSHIDRGEYPIWLLVLATIAVLGGIWVVANLIRRLFYGFVRISNDGIEYRRTRKISRVEWPEVTGAEFGWRGRWMVGMKIHRGDGVKPLRLMMGHFYRKESRERVEALIRARVPVEFQVERKMGWWKVRW